MCIYMKRSRNGITFKFLPFIYLTFVLGAQKNRLDKLNEMGCFSCFGCSKDSSHSDDYFKNPQHMPWLTSKKNYF